jgi:molecular chaperone DnaK
VVAYVGGGTFDVSVLDVGGGFVEVIATSGDAHLGEYNHLLSTILPAT